MRLQSTRTKYLHRNERVNARIHIDWIRNRFAHHLHWMWSRDESQTNWFCMQMTFCTEMIVSWSRVGAIQRLFTHRTIQSTLLHADIDTDSTQHPALHPFPGSMPNISFSQNVESSFFSQFYPFQFPSKYVAHHSLFRIQFPFLSELDALAVVEIV